MPQRDADIGSQCCDRARPLTRSNAFQRLLYVRRQRFHGWMACRKHGLRQAFDRQTLHYLVLPAVSYFALSAAVYSYFCCRAMQSLCVMSSMGAILSEVHLMIIFYISEFALYAVFPFICSQMTMDLTSASIPATKILYPASSPSIFKPEPPL